MSRLAGTSYLQIDEGDFWPVADDTVTYSTGGPQREAIVGMSEVAGYSEKVSVPFIEGSFFDIPDRDFEKLKKMTNVKARLDKPNGISILLTGAWFVGPLEGDTDGKIKFRFEAKKGSVTK